MGSPVQDRVEFDYRLTGFGWSETRLVIGDRSAKLTASYESDALADLLEALLNLCDGASTTRVSWEEEPGEYRWLFERKRNVLTIRVLWFDDLEDERLADERGDERIAGCCRLDTFVEAVASGARALVQEHGQQGYRKKWDQHDFPMTLLQALEKELVKRAT